jgi:release factor glutamine methyltransferase
MRIIDAQKIVEERLSDAGIEDVRVNSRRIICKVLGLSLTEFLLHKTDEISESDFAAISDMTDRRANREPLQYLLGSWNFYGLEFKVGKGVLIPREETEFIVEFALANIPEDAECNILDLCSGSGCIGLTIAKKRPKCRLYLLEKSDEAIKYIQENVKNLELTNITILHEDMFEFESGMKFDAILSNPPYIESDEIKSLQAEVKKEPAMALDGGTDGLDFYRHIADKYFDYLKQGGFVVVESGEEQPPKIAEMFEKLKNIQIHDDCFGVERFVSGEKK